MPDLGPVEIKITSDADDLAGVAGDYAAQLRKAAGGALLIGPVQPLRHEGEVIGAQILLSTRARGLFRDLLVAALNQRHCGARACSNREVMAAAREPLPERLH